MKYHFGMYSDIGNFRPNNEDRCVIAPINNASDAYVIAVCDGIGGMEKGEVASTAIVENIAEWAAQYSGNGDLDSISRSYLDFMYNVNDRIVLDCQLQNIETGSTLCSVIVSGDEYMVANVGDSRSYLVNKTMTQLTTDDVTHSSGGKRGALTQCIGHGNNLYINTSKGTFAKNDCIFICSDGFYKEMDTKRMIKICRAATRLTNIEKVLIKETENIKKTGEKDNITSCLFKYFGQ